MNKRELERAIRRVKKLRNALVCAVWDAEAAFDRDGSVEFDVDSFCVAIDAVIDEIGEERADHVAARKRR